MTDDPTDSDVATLLGGRVPAAEHVGALLRRIDALDQPGTATALRSVIAVSPRALDDAAACDRGEAGGPLRGIPVLVKDSIEAVGLPATAGSLALAGRPPGRDAALVTRLRAAGAVVLGSTNLSEWANIRSTAPVSGWSAVGGLTRNPWGLDRSAGGSSSGSGAAVAAGLAPLAVGTETDGSIVCPASLNGVVGIKPAVGSVPSRGIVPISHSQDSAGAMARTAADAALLLEVLMSRPGVAARVRRGAAGLRAGVARTWRTGHAQTDGLFDEALARLRAAGASTHGVEAAVAAADVEEDELTVLLGELRDDLGAYLADRPGVGVRSLADVVAFNRANAGAELAHFGQELFERALELGGSDTAECRAARARNLCWALEDCLEPALDGLDVLVAPAYGPAWASDLARGDPGDVGSGVTTGAAIAGWPIACAPMGLADGLPVGFAVVGRPGAEGAMLAVCAAVERPSRPPGLAG